MHHYYKTLSSSSIYFIYLFIFSQISFIWFFQDVEELMKEVQEARRIIMLHQPSKVFIRPLVLILLLIINSRIPCELFPLCVIALFGLIYLWSFAVFLWMFHVLCGFLSLLFHSHTLVSKCFWSIDPFIFTMFSCNSS